MTGTAIVKRPPRRPGPDLPDGEVALDPPPTLPPAGGVAWMQLMTVVPMLAGSVAMALMFTNGRGGTLAYVTGGLFGVSMLGVVGTSLLGQGGRLSKRESLAARRDYMRRLSQLRRAVRRTIREQRLAMFYRHPDPDILWWIADGPRLWERRPADGDFAVVRMALGPLKLATPLRPPATAPVEDLEPLCAAALRRFVTTYAIVPDLPVALDLRGFARVYVRGDRQHSQALVRALLAQAAVLHAPDDLLVAACYAGDHAGDWEWLKWLPHALHPDKTDALGPVRLMARSLHTIEGLLDTVLAHRPRFNPSSSSVDGPHLLVVCDDGDTNGAEHLIGDGGVDGVTVIDLGGRPPRVLDDRVLVLEVTGAAMTTTTVDGTKEIGRPDALSLRQVEALARQLAPLRLSATAHADEPLAAVASLTELLGLADPHAFDPAISWRPRPSRDRLRVPIGVTPDGGPVELDLKESAEDGMGPHGLLVGATGSGKSELLRTLVLALACNHSSQLLNFVLIDFKGGATFTRLDRLPHTSAVITNLAAEITLVERMEAAIHGELIRRQELLRTAGNFTSKRDYERARSSGAALAPLPSLLIVCDEFSELLAAKPEFIDLFMQIGRLGRSLGIHLLLASQKLEEGRLRGLEGHLSYRIGLRTFSTIESRVVLGVGDAYELPRSPGHGYLRSGNDPLTRFKAAYVSGAYRPAGPALADADGQPLVPALPYVAEYVAPALQPIQPGRSTPATRQDSAVLAEPDDADILGESLLDILVARMIGQGPRRTRSGWRRWTPHPPSTP